MVGACEEGEFGRPSDQKYLLAQGVIDQGRSRGMNLCVCYSLRILQFSSEEMRTCR